MGHPCTNIFVHRCTDFWRRCSKQWNCSTKFYLLLILINIAKCLLKCFTRLLPPAVYHSPTSLYSHQMTPSTFNFYQTKQRDRSVFQWAPPILTFLCLTSPNSLHLFYILVKWIYSPSPTFLPPSVDAMCVLMLSIAMPFCLYFHMLESSSSFVPQLKYHCWEETFTDSSNLTWSVLLLNLL